MTIKHHPAPEYLMSCAAGSMPESLAAVMASHMSMCSRCRSELADLDLIGAALLEEVHPEPLESEMLLPRLAKSSVAVDAREQLISDVPEPLQQFVGRSLNDVGWLHASQGVWQFPIPLAQHSNASLCLFKIASGFNLPHKRHMGSKMVMVLQGELSDGQDRYGGGDVIEFEEAESRPMTAGEGRACVCLAAWEAPVS